MPYQPHSSYLDGWLMGWSRPIQDCQCTSVTAIQTGGWLPPNFLRVKFYQLLPKLSQDHYHGLNCVSSSKYSHHPHFYWGQWSYFELDRQVMHRVCPCGYSNLTKYGQHTSCVTFWDNCWLVWYRPGDDQHTPWQYPSILLDIFDYYMNQAQKLEKAKVWQTLGCMCHRPY